MNPEDWLKIRNLYFKEGYSQRKIAEMLHLSRWTVKSAILKEGVLDLKNSPKKKSSKLDPYKGMVDDLLQKYPSITAVRIFEEIKKAGYEGKMTILGDYIRSKRGGRKEAYLRVETLPGEQAQVDWCKVGLMPFGEYKRTISGFVMVLSFSRAMYVEFCPSERIEDFLRCHQNAFRYFGGIPRKILYDNLRSVVLERSGSEVRFNPRFIDFAGFYLFEPTLCNPGKAHEKGKVESGIRYLKKNFLLGREFKDFSDLATKCKDWLNDVANKRVHATTRKRPIDMLNEERESLQPLPKGSYDCDITISCRSTKDGMVRFDTNQYSVPFKYSSMILTLKVSPHQVKIYSDSKLVATHPRCYLKHQVIEDPSHIKVLVKMKSKGLHLKAREEFLNLGEPSQRYFDGLLQRPLRLDCHISKILKMVRDYGRAEVLGAMDEALRYGAFGAQYIQNIILRKRSLRGERIYTGGVSIKSNPDLENIRLRERSLSSYEDIVSD
jgi:transposase